jgi:hypothetical protein
MRHVLLILIVWGTLCSHVLAERAVILPPKRDAGLSDDLANQLVSGLVRELRESGREVMDPNEASAAVPLLVPNCWSVECALKVREATNSDIAIILSIFKRDAHSSIGLMVVESAQAQYGAGALLESGNHTADARTTLRVALEKRKRGPGPWLTTDISPEGAVIKLDAEVIGLAPLKPRRVVPGEHLLEISKDGYQTVRRMFTVSPGADTEVPVIQESLATADAPAAQRNSRTRKKATWRDHLLGAASIVIGGSLAIARPAHNLALKDECVNSACTSKYGWDKNNYALIVTGAVVVGVGSYTAWGLKPFGRATANEQSAGLIFEEQF